MFKLNAVFLLLALSSNFSLSAYATTARTLRFTLPVAPPGHRSPAINYNIDLANASFAAYIPEQMQAADSNQWGLIVFIGSDAVTDVPPDWLPVLARRRLIFISPQNAGNSQNQAEREGLAVVAARQMIVKYGLNQSRIYCAGFSGGARAACDLGFQQSDLFSATIQSCGADFYRRVRAVNATSQVDTNGNEYGLTEALAEEIAEAKRKVRFVLITGESDFRRGNILDIYHQGFSAERFQSKLLDAGGMGHEICSAYYLEQALIFIEGR